MRIYRPDSLMTIYDFARLSSIPLEDIYNGSFQNCIDSVRSVGCKNWVEYPGQQPNRPSRHNLKEIMGDVEFTLSQYLGYPVGPTIYENEQHNMTGLNRTIRLDYNKVIQTGTPIYTEMTYDTLTRTFVDSSAWGYEDCIQYEFTNVSITDTNDLFIWETGLDPTSTAPEIHMGNRLRPFRAKLEGTTLTIIMPVAIAVRYDLYSQFANKQGTIRAIDLCDPDSFPDSISVFKRSFEMPAGTLKYSTEQDCCHDGSCDACQLSEIPICLEPVNAERGSFKVKPIVNTAEEGEEPCWEVAKGWGHCCDIYGYYVDASCLLHKPVSVCVTYMAGCEGCWHSQTTDEVCERFKKAIHLLTCSRMPKKCDCDCVSGLTEYYQQDLLMIQREQRFTGVGDEDQYKFGVTRGAVEAYYQVLKHNRDKRIEAIAML